ncbi:hypothetical protein OAW79_02035, partial [Candidatus Pelagibacter sp.]|nr:hypothetical protein [Candidatus Pelagibacter sp.]
MPQQTPLFNVILLAAGGFFMFVCMDSTAKFLGTVMPVTQAIWGRFFFHLVSLIIFFLIFKPKVNGNDGLISLKIFAAITKSAKF